MLDGLERQGEISWQRVLFLHRFTPGHKGFAGVALEVEILFAMVFSAGSASAAQNRPSPDTSATLDQARDKIKHVVVDNTGEPLL
jgi:hypothetical protein